MMTTFHEYRGAHALLVSEEGITIAVPVERLAAAGLGTLRTGQRLVIALDDQGTAESVRLP